jgi:hypothetical protein
MQVDEEKEAKKAEQARLMLAGKSFLDDDDIFKGMTPQVRRLRTRGAGWACGCWPEGGQAGDRGKLRTGGWWAGA